MTLNFKIVLIKTKNMHKFNIKYFILLYKYKWIYIKVSISF